MYRSKKNNGAFYALLAAVIVLMAIGSNTAYEDEQKEAEHYCDMVRDGAWPDYNNNYASICNGK